MNDCADFIIDFDENTGPPGLSAYEIAVQNGFVGTEQEWLDSFKDHSKLTNRNMSNQHSIDAITGLKNELDNKQPKGDYLITELDPTVPEWAKNPNKPTYTATEVNAEPIGSISSHNTSNSSHNDIRVLIQELTQRLNTLVDSDDTTLDQLSEIVAYIKSNKSLIDQITTEKINISDIVDNLTTNINNKPLSSSMGVELKRLIDNIKIPTMLSELSDDTMHRTVSDSEKTEWSEKLSQSNLQNGIDAALEQAKTSGEFNGADGKTPVKGVDYWTASDKQSIVNDVLQALPTWSGGAY